MSETILTDWLRRLPKVELHLHLEGAIAAADLWVLMQKYGGDPAVPDRAALARRLRYRDFAHFIDTWVWKNGFLREYEDFTFIAAAAAGALARQHVLHAEVFFSPPDFRRHGLETARLAAAIRAGFDQVPEVEIGLVGDLVRDFGPAAAATTLAELAEVRAELGIAGIGIGGSEQRFPPAPFAGVFAAARRRGFRTAAHAGEAAGAASVRGALAALAVDRIGHGTRSREDPALLDELAARQVPLEMCPLSNLRTGVVERLAAHPVRAFFDRGLCVTINTDDPAMFGNSLAGEYRALVETFGFSAAELRRLLLHAAHASWLAPAARAALAASIERSPLWRDPPC